MYQYYQHYQSIKHQHQQPHPKVAESKNIEANHLGFTKFLFQHYCQHLGLTPNYILAESAFNFYINEKIAYLLRTATNIESARETFYNKLIQNSSLPTNYNFTSIIIEINKKIEHHTQQRYPITYASKDKRKLQTPAKHRVELLTNPSYHYTSGSAINITSTGASTLNVTSTFGQFSFQSKQRKEDLLRPYAESIQQLLQQPLQQPNLDPIAYAPIAKLENFTSKEDDAQVWLNDMEKTITANEWNDA
ncbi:hypothetical protein G9A89_018604 [Geosiphon pyriformis]|nr:hypothetical protein G9A89_018604 [Geosiphon pyriformis]